MVAWTLNRGELGILLEESTARLIFFMVSVQWVRGSRSVSMLDFGFMIIGA